MLFLARLPTHPLTTCASTNELLCARTFCLPAAPIAPQPPSEARSSPTFQSPAGPRPAPKDGTTVAPTAAASHLPWQHTTSNRGTRFSEKTACKVGNGRTSKGGKAAPQSINFGRARRRSRLVQSPERAERRENPKAANFKAPRAFLVRGGGDSSGRGARWRNREGVCKVWRPSGANPTA